MTNPTTYRCLTPEQAAKDRQDFRVRMATFRECVKQLEQELPGPLTVFNCFDGGCLVTGYQHPRGEEIPVGWRVSKVGVARPAKRTPEGKALADRFRNEALDGEKVSGMPWHFSTPSEPRTGTSYSIWPNVVELDGQWWVHLSREPDDRSTTQIDLTIWQPVNESDYFLAKEAEHAKNKEIQRSINPGYGGYKMSQALQCSADGNLIGDETP